MWQYWQMTSNLNLVCIIIEKQLCMIHKIKIFFCAETNKNFITEWGLEKEKGFGVPDYEYMD